jgi:hypothetical protein
LLPHFPYAYAYVLPYPHLTTYSKLPISETSSAIYSPGFVAAVFNCNTYTLVCNSPGLGHKSTCCLLLHTQCIYKGCTAVCWQENTTLIVELNDLRRELKATRKKISDMESILGTSSSYMNPKEMQAHLQRAVQSHEDIHTEYKSKIKVSLLDDWKEADITG